MTTTSGRSLAVEPAEAASAARLVAALTEGGALRDPGWRSAFTGVPRSRFVPYFFRPTLDRPGWELIEPPDPRWSTAIDGLDALVTQVGGDDSDAAARIRAGAAVDGAATSSNSSPVLVTAMLHELRVGDGDRVLEVGTGTGWNAALLAYRLGDNQVASVDVDPGLVATARGRLASLGLHPQLLAADGVNGAAARGPYDRIVATVAVPRVPAPWLRQVAPGGMILAPLDLSGRGGLLAALTVTRPGAATGRFSTTYAGFMPLRANLTSPGDILAATGQPAAVTRPTGLPATAATDPQDPFEFLAALSTGGYDHLTFSPDDGGPDEVHLTAPDGSWAVNTAGAGGHTVAQGGPRLLWDLIEAAFAHWNTRGRPTRDRYGLTVEPEGHTVWLDTPDDPQAWPLRC